MIERTQENWQELEFWQIYQDYLAPNAPKSMENLTDTQIRSSIRCLGDNPGYEQLLVRKYGTQEDYEAWIRQNGQPMPPFAPVPIDDKDA